MVTNNPIICAIDTSSLSHAQKLADEVGERVGAIKLGLEFYLKFGIEGVNKVTHNGQLPLFLDLKFHDIPNTVAGAIRSVAPCNPFMLTVHTAGGEEMLRRAKTEAIEAASLLNFVTPKIIGVTMLTSLDDKDTHAIGFGQTTVKTTQQLTKLAKKTNIDGVVCSGHELIPQKEKNDFIYVTPGIRLEGEANDQKRVMTPGEAIKRGATYLVIGREITQADNKHIAIEKILENINDANG